MTSQNPKKTNKAGVIGAGVFALTAAAVAYLLVGPKGKANREKLKGWVIKMKGEVVEKLENAKEITEPVFKKIVSEVAEKYKKIKNISPEELDAVVADIEKHWKSIVRESKAEKGGKKKTARKKA